MSRLFPLLVCLGLCASCAHAERTAENTIRGSDERWTTQHWVGIARSYLASKGITSADSKPRVEFGIGHAATRVAFTRGFDERIVSINRERIVIGHVVIRTPQ